MCRLSSGILLLITGATVPAHADTLTVCSSGCDYTSIQAAIDAANRGTVFTPEDTIELGAETFLESPVIENKYLAIRGAGASITVIDGGFSVTPYDAVVAVVASAAAAGGLGGGQVPVLT